MEEIKKTTAETTNDTVTLPGASTLGPSIRAASVLTAFIAFTLPMMLVQSALLKFSPPHARKLPGWYHRRVCRLLGIRLHIDGEIASGRPVLIVSNHISWLDIPILSTIAPVSFVAKSEVGTWPVVSWLARLQRSIFINRERKADVGRVSNTMAERLAEGDLLVLFAEGTSTDGNRVLPFRSALLSPAFQKDTSDKKQDTTDGKHAAEPVVQTLSLAYTHLHGVPLGREGRKVVAWYGDMDMLSHAWKLLKAGPLDARISMSEPIALKDYQNRKELAQSAEQQVRTNVVRMLRGEP